MRILPHLLHVRACGLLLLGVATGCAPHREETPVSAPTPGRAEQTAPSSPTQSLPSPEPGPNQVPYQGAFGPGEAPVPPLSDMHTPLNSWVKEALDVWWKRPSPKGPAPIALAQPKAIYFSGEGPVIQVLPGAPAFPEKIPKYLQTFYPPKIPYSNHVKQLPRGSIRVVAYDNTLNDSKLSKDSMEVEISFTDAEGAEWRIEQVMLAPISPNPIAEPWLGGLVIDTLYHGHTGNGTPAEPLVKCELCSWGWADIYKNDKRVASSALLHIMLTSDVRAGAEKGFAYQCYDCAENPVREVHVIVPPMEYLPSPGGYLHIMWEDASWKEGAPQQIAAMAPKLGKDLPTIEISAVPYLRWDKTEIHLKAGQKYRLIVHNNDPSSFHQFHLHAMPEGAEEKPQNGMRHDEGGFAGGTGPLWQPGMEKEKGGNPPATRNVFFSLPQGSTWATTIEFDKPGEYMFMCPVGNHHLRGMEGKFIVSANGEGGAK